MVPAINHDCRYAYPSTLQAGRLRLAVSGAPGREVPFLEARLARSMLTARLLRVISFIAGMRFHVPPGMLTRILAAADPVVTSGGGMLRFESFSPCAGVYARLDLHPDAMETTRSGPGTTNVDFGHDMRAALARVRSGDAISVSIGTEEFQLDTSAGTVIERKVRLPVRWLKSFLEVQAAQVSLERMFTVSAAEATRFLRDLPARGGREPAWVVQSGRGLRLSQRPAAESARLHGPERLHALRDVAPQARAMHVFSDVKCGSSAYVLDFGDQAATLLLSPESWRGFSGEGAALEWLADPRRADVLAEVRAHLRWQANMHTADLAAHLGADPASIHAALAALGARGLVGYDLGQSAWFHRELPFDVDAVESMHPRLLAARRLVADQAVKVISRDDGIVAEVLGSEVVHRVRAREGAESCTCTWHARHRGERGPCKHILAVALLEGEWE